MTSISHTIQRPAEKTSNLYAEESEMNELYGGEVDDLLLAHTQKTCFVIDAQFFHVSFGKLSSSKSSINF